jgi:fumarate hydratase subunit beta
MTIHRIEAPLIDAEINKLRVGDEVLITGTIFVARDAAHKKLVEQINNGELLPFALLNQVIYYMGPSPAKPGEVIGSAGPTTSSRMDQYTPLLLEHGLRGMIGKGKRSVPVRESMKKNGVVYFAAVGGAAALISRQIKAAETIAYPELGPEAILRLEVDKFPAIVVNDVCGDDLFDRETVKYLKSVSTDNV